jgi:hypothetical protein
MRSILQVELTIEHDEPWQQPRDDEELDTFLGGSSYGRRSNGAVIDSVGQIEYCGEVE